MNITIDKMPSIVRNLNLSKTVKVSANINPVEGGVIVIEALEDQGTNNVFEYDTGRLGRLIGGDITFGVFAKRRALREYSGDIPNHVKVGDELYFLCESGLVGEIGGLDEAWGKPLPVRVLGAVVDENGQQLNIKDQAIPHKATLPFSAPIIAMVGTIMDIGKTTALVELIKFMKHKGLKIAGAKVTGVGYMQDPLKMLDAGAYPVLDFVDAGLPSTCGSADDALHATLGVLAELNKSNPDVIVIEFGDGILGEYNVSHILSHPEIKQHLAATIVAAGDLVGAWGAQQLLAQHNLTPLVVTGVAVNNDTAVSYIEKNLRMHAESNQNGMPQTKKLLWSHLQPYIFKQPTAVGAYVSNNGKH
jgi:hypothetical protein